MRGFNKVVLAGNLTGDPDLRYTVNKRAYLRFNLAINSNYRNANGEIQENTDFIAITMWGNMAESLSKYLRKGSPVLIEGRVRSGSFTAKDGSKRYTTDIVADNLIMLGSSNKDKPNNSMDMGGDFPAEWGHSNDNQGFGQSLDERPFDGNLNPDGGDDIPF